MPLIEEKESPSSGEKYELFQSLILNLEQLEKALQAEPNLMKEQDESGMTLLHHMMLSQNFWDEEHLSPETNHIVDLLLNHPQLDFNIKNFKDHTALHAGAITLSHVPIENQFIHRSIYIKCLKKAEECGFNFSTPSQSKGTLLHVVVEVPYPELTLLIRSVIAESSYNKSYSLRVINNLEMLLDTIKNPGINCLDAAGQSPFSYAVKNLQFEAANFLLEAGALLPPNPAGLIKELSMLTEEENTALRLLQSKSKSQVEVEKNARVLGQGARSSSSGFFALPKEILILIATATKTAKLGSKKELEVETQAALRCL